MSTSTLPGAAAVAGVGDLRSPHYPLPFNPTPPYPHGFPIEGAPPDITRWAAGNTGIPYLWSFEGARPGPHAAIVALTHGEEWSGAHAVDLLLREKVRPLHGRLSLLFANWQAHARWIPEEPNRAFYIDRDLNRVWSPEVLDAGSTDVEIVRARELRPFVDSVDFLLDLHSTQQPSPPMALVGGLDRTAVFAQAMGWPSLVIRDMPHAAGRRLRDWGEFETPEGHRTALVVECGQHWVATTVDHARNAALTFLRYLGMAPTALLAMHPIPEHEGVRIIQTTHSVTARTDACELLQVWPDLAMVARGGTLLGHDGDVEIRTPYDNAMLILPMRRPRRGLTAVRFGRFVG